MSYDTRFACRYGRPEPLVCKECGRIIYDNDYRALEYGEYMCEPCFEELEEEDEIQGDD